MRPGWRCWAERAGWRLVPNETIAGHGLERQDHDRGRPSATCTARPGCPPWWSGTSGTALTSLVGSGLPEAATVVCEASSFRLEDTACASRPTPSVLLNLAEDHLDRHGTFDAYRAAKLPGLRPPAAGTGRRGRPALLAGDILGEAQRVLFGVGADVASAAPAEPGAPGPAARLVERDGSLWWKRRAADAGRGDPPTAAPTTGSTRMAAAAVHARPRDVPGRRARRAREPSAGSPTGSRRSRRATALLYVNDSKATNVASRGRGPRVLRWRRPPDPRRQRRKGSDYAPLAAPVAERARAVYLIGGDRAGASRAALAGRRRPAPRRRRSRARGRRGPRRRAARRRRPALAGLRLVRPVRGYEAREEHFRALVT